MTRTPQLLLALYCTLAPCQSLLGAETQAAAERFDDRIERWKPRAGDLVFRRGSGLLSEASLMTELDAEYSHVGIVYVGAEGPMIVHAAPSSSFVLPASISIDPIEGFLGPGAASRFAVYRLRDARGREDAMAAAMAAYSFAEDGTLFDNEFSLETIDEMYCTELVWRAFLATSVDLLGSRRTDVYTPFGAKSVITVRDLRASASLEEVFHSSN